MKSNHAVRISDTFVVQTTFLWCFFQICYLATLNECFRSVFLPRSSKIGRWRIRPSRSGLFARGVVNRNPFLQNRECLIKFSVSITKRDHDMKNHIVSTNYWWQIDWHSWTARPPNNHIRSVSSSPSYRESACQSIDTSAEHNSSAPYSEKFSKMELLDESDRPRRTHRE